jgi:uncharacterized protein YjiK
MKKATGIKISSALLMCVGAVLAVSPLPGADPYPYTVAENIDQVKFKEPSGLCFHPIRQTLFVVGDGGDVGELRTDGTMLRQKRIRKADFEGITCNPATGLLYIAVEGEDAILEMNPDSFEILRTFKIERFFEGELRMKSGGDGIEAIAFVPDVEHPDGGRFYVANQGKDLANATDVSALFEVEVPLSRAQTNAAARIIRFFSIGAIDMAGLHYDAASKQLLVVSDKMNSLFRVTLDGRVLSACSLPGVDQEGVALDSEGLLYIAQDSGGILKLKP